MLKDRPRVIVFTLTPPKAAPFRACPGELLFRVTTGHVALLRPKRPNARLNAHPMFILSMPLISKAFAPDSIFGRDSGSATGC
jgi:hypothetical protein